MIPRLVWVFLLFLSCVNDASVPISVAATEGTSTKNVTASDETEEWGDEPTCETAKSRWREDHLEEVLAAWHFEDDEESKLLELRVRLSDIDHWKNDPQEVARFLKEHNFDVDKSELMFRKMIAWRLEHNVDTFLERYGEPPALFHYAPLFLLKGLDKEGDPIFVERIGKLDAWGLYNRLGGPEAMEDALRFVSEVHTSREVGIREEWQWQKLYFEKVTGRRVTQFTILIDLDGLSPQLLRPAMFGILQRGARIAQDYYPGLAKRIVMVRAPRIFQMAWNVAVRFFDKRVHHKFIFTSHEDYLEVLSEYMDLEVLPDVMYPGGGKGTQMPGFFEKIHMEGGQLPEEVPTTSDEETTANTPVLSDVAAASA